LVHMFIEFPIGQPLFTDNESQFFWLITCMSWQKGPDIHCFLQNSKVSEMFFNNDGLFSAAPFPQERMSLSPKNQK
jgi:hypothetical protein